MRLSDFHIFFNKLIKNVATVYAISDYERSFDLTQTKFRIRTRYFNFLITLKFIYQSQGDNLILAIVNSQDKNPVNNYRILTLADAQAVDQFIDNLSKLLNLIQHRELGYNIEYES